MIPLFILEDIKAVIKCKVFFTSYGRPKRILAFLDVAEAISSKSVFLRRAISCAVKVTKSGSFLFPLLGTGARKGASVSISIYSSGMLDAASIT